MTAAPLGLLPWRVIGMPPLHRGTPSSLKVWSPSLWRGLALGCSGMMGVAPSVETRWYIGAASKPRSMITWLSRSEDPLNIASSISSNTGARTESWKLAGLV